MDRPRPRAPAAALLLQVEAVETAIYLTEAASKFNDAWIANELREFADDANPGLLRIALKMTTGVTIRKASEKARVLRARALC